MRLSSENENRYWDLINGLINQIQTRVQAEEGMTLVTDILLPHGHFDDLHITEIYIDEDGFPCVKIEGDDEERYFDIFSVDDLMIIVNKI